MSLYPSMTTSNTALVVIDPINACAHEKCEFSERHITFSKIRTMLPKLQLFLQEYRKKVGGPIIFTTTTPWTKEYLPKNLQELYEEPESNYYSNDPTGFGEQFHTVTIEDTDIVIAKKSYDAFSNEQFVRALQEKGIQYIVITGVFTDGCVLSTIVNGFSRGYSFVILKDLVETTDSQTRQLLQKLLLEFTFPKMYGRTMGSGEFIKNFLLSRHRNER